MNFRYSWSGSPPTKPLRVFDNGEFTYFAFADGQSVPAIFSVDADGNEALVNHHVRGEYVVVERLGSQFSLRSGDFVTCIFNDLRPHPSAKRSKERTPL
jgi:type IV secretion system protein VirB9